MKKNKSERLHHLPYAFAARHEAVDFVSTSSPHSEVSRQFLLFVEYAFQTGLHLERTPLADKRLFFFSTGFPERNSSLDFFFSD